MENHFDLDVQVGEATVDVTRRDLTGNTSCLISCDIDI
ncbi:FDLD family class I lanthipeptide [Tumebacillus avium]